MQIADIWLRDMPQQFQGKHNIEVLVKAFSKQMQELEKVFQDINTMTDLNVFVKRPRTEQLKSVKEWMLWAVTKAEKELGSGTGKLKLRYVYDMFVAKFPWLGSVVSFEMVSMMVDDALEEMRAMLESNKAVNEYVNGLSEAEQTRKEQ